MEDPDVKKELDKIPDVDENGNPIYKIDEDPSEEITLEDVPGFMRDKTETRQGNEQDIKDETSEE
jgi:hypothetical protein